MSASPAYDFTRNHFALFGLEPVFGLDENRLEARYREIQVQIHPDRFAQAGETERRLSMQWATQVNEAFQTLRQPLARARYLLQLQGVDTQEESNTAMPPAFLMQQMEWREDIIDARRTGDIDALEQLQARLKKETRSLLATLAEDIDARRDLPAAAQQVRMLKFLEKLREDIAHAIEALDH